MRKDLNFHGKVEVEVFFVVEGGGEWMVCSTINESALLEQSLHDSCSFRSRQIAAWQE